MNREKQWRENAPGTYRRLAACQVEETITDRERLELSMEGLLPLRFLDPANFEPGSPEEEA